MVHSSLPESAVKQSRPALRNSTVKTLLTWVGLTSLVIAGAIVGLRQVRFYEKAELEAYDQMVRWHPQKPTDNRVVVIGIGEKEIQTRNEYPIHDGTLAELLTKLETYEPRVIGVDIGRDVPQGSAKGRQQLLQAIQNNSNIIMACKLSSTDDPGVPAPPNTPEGQVAFADLPTDIDGTIRRSSLISTPQATAVKFGQTHTCNDVSADNEVPSLAFLLSMIYLEQEQISVKPLSSQVIQAGKARLERLRDNHGSYVNAEANDFQIMLNYRRPHQAVREVAMADVLAGQVDESLLKDRLVLIGYTSQIVKDTVKTPFLETQPGMREMHGVYVHAQVASHLLSTALNQQNSIISWAEWTEIFYIWVWVLVGGLIAFYSRKTWVLVLLGGVAFASTWAIAYGLFTMGWWIPVIPVAWGLGVSLVTVSVLSQAARRGYTQAFFQQLQEQVSGQLQQSRTSRQDYFENLVRKARQIRSQRDGLDLSEEERATALGQDILNLKFDSPETQKLYEQLRQQWLSEQGHQIIEQKQQQQQTSRTEEITKLLDRSRSVRSQLLGYPVFPANSVTHEPAPDLDLPPSLSVEPNGVVMESNGVAIANRSENNLEELQEPVNLEVEAWEYPNPADAEQQSQS
ncbi:MAG: CHASE2 domain-containing protein [Synechococcales bacterium]|nr:CHASE2 domain-containing protein [Synechococcales bacterium]